jgi:hypothetical protein
LRIRITVYVPSVEGDTVNNDVGDVTMGRNERPKQSWTEEAIHCGCIRRSRLGRLNLKEIDMLDEKWVVKVGP